MPRRDVEHTGEWVCQYWNVGVSSLRILVGSGSHGCYQERVEVKIWLGMWAWLVLILHASMCVVLVYYFHFDSVITSKLGYTNCEYVQYFLSEVLTISTG